MSLSGWPKDKQAHKIKTIIPPIENKLLKRFYEEYYKFILCWHLKPNIFCVLSDFHHHSQSFSVPNLYSYLHAKSRVRVLKGLRMTVSGRNKLLKHLSMSCNMKREDAEHNIIQLSH